MYIRHCLVDGFDLVRVSLLILLLKVPCSTPDTWIAITHLPYAGDIPAGEAGRAC